jgi:hypothetical protein
MTWLTFPRLLSRVSLSIPIIVLSPFSLRRLQPSDAMSLLSPLRRCLCSSAHPRLPATRTYSISSKQASNDNLLEETDPVKRKMELTQFMDSMAAQSRTPLFPALISASHLVS